MRTPIERVWAKAKSNFILGKDYIETETEEYIVFCPFNNLLISYLDDLLYGKYHLCHCVVGLGAFKYWYSTLYRDGRLKTFFIRKDIDLYKSVADQPKLAEFTGWIDFSDRNFLHFAHLVDNSLATGSYERYKAEPAYSREVTKEFREEVDEINRITSQVYDSLFEQYDKYIDKLEETLHNILDDF